MTLNVLPQDFSVCKATAVPALPEGVCFFARTDTEISVVCETDRINFDAIAREDDWRALRVAGTLDFSLTGILAKIAGVLAEAGISVFCVSTYDTDYVLVRSGVLSAAIDALCAAGYLVAR